MKSKLLTWKTGGHEGEKYRRRANKRANPVPSNMSLGHDKCSGVGDGRAAAITEEAATPVLVKVWGEVGNYPFARMLIYLQDGKLLERAGKGQAFKKGSGGLF